MPGCVYICLSSCFTTKVAPRGEFKYVLELISVDYTRNHILQLSLKHRLWFQCNLVFAFLEITKYFANSSTLLPSQVSQLTPHFNTVTVTENGGMSRVINICAFKKYDRVAAISRNQNMGQQLCRKSDGINDSFQRSSITY